jgi:hypothetical protein
LSEEARLRAEAEEKAPADITIDTSAFEVPVVVPAPAPGSAVVLSPGEAAVAQERYPRHSGRHIVVTETEVLLVNGLLLYRCARPGMGRPGGPPEIKRLVVAFVHRRAIGPLDKGHRFVYAIGATDRLLGTVDDSDTWPFRLGQIEALCTTVGIEHAVEVFEDVRELVEARPEWAAPELEFEVNHPRQETAWEWTNAFLWFNGLACLFGGGLIAAFFLSPVGHAYRVPIISAEVIFLALDLSARSRRRMRRSMARRDARIDAIRTSRSRSSADGPPRSG